jgi:hypothetical protein
MTKLRNNVVALVLILAMASCVRRGVVSYETVQSFRPAQGSVAMGYNGAALNAATRISEVRQKCGTPLGEWQEQIPFFAPQVKKLRYKTYDNNNNILTTTFSFVMNSSDPSLIGISYEQPSN